MNITVRNPQLTAELRLLSKIVATKPTIPVLSYVLVEAGEWGLRLSATDMEIALVTACPANVHETGTTTLPAKKLLELLDQLPDAEINLALDGEQVRVTVGTFRSRILTLPAKDFITVPAVNGDSAVIPATNLRLLIERTQYAISEKVQKYVLDGALLSMTGDVAAMVATDGKRLSVATTSRPAGTDRQVLVPSKTLDALIPLCEAGDVEISFSDRHIFFVSGQRTLVSRMLEGQFPKYDRIIPRDSNKKIVVDRNVAATALRRMCVVSDDERSVYFECSPDGLHLTSRSAGLGDADELVPATEHSGDPVKVCANGRHVLDFLERATERTVTLQFKEATTPILLTDGSDFLNVVLTRRSS